MHGAEWKSEGKADSETDEESHVDDSDPDQGQEGLKKDKDWVYCRIKPTFQTVQAIKEFSSIRALIIKKNQNC